MPSKLDLLSCATKKSLVKKFEEQETIYFSSSIFKFNDYKKKQSRNILITNRYVYNLDDFSIKRKIDIKTIGAVTVSRIGTQFILHVPTEYDYRFASSDHRDQIIYFILKSYRELKKERLPIYYRDDLSLVGWSITKDEAKKQSNRIIKGEPTLHDDHSYEIYLEGEEEEKALIRKNTKTLFARENLKEEVNINDFVPKIVLGKGAFGTVFLVEYKKTKEVFAMKCIIKEDILKKDQVEHTKTEKMILQHINHPFLVNLAYAFQTPEKLYFIMQFMRGGQLFQHLSNAKKFPEKQAKFYAMQMALGLGYLHSKNFIYRDLKLENVLMDDYGNLCLTDFGMARVVKDGEIASTFCGTPEYLAPQVLAGAGYNVLADWWSLGIITYQMMYGLPPFHNKSQATMFKLIRDGELKFPDKVTVSVEAKQFLVKILCKNPQNRLGSKGDLTEVLAHPWFQSLDADKMLKKELQTPFKPKIQGDSWIGGFDKQFTSQKAVYDQKGNTNESDQSKQVFKTFF